MITFAEDTRSVTKFLSDVMMQIDIVVGKWQRRARFTVIDTSGTCLVIDRLLSFWFWSRGTIYQLKPLS